MPWPEPPILLRDLPALLDLCGDDAEAIRAVWRALAETLRGPGNDERSRARLSTETDAIEE
jgi:hypothetical protein